MANSIADQANALVNSDPMKAIRGNIAELENQGQEANFAQQAASVRQKVFQQISEYQKSGAEQEKIQGQGLIKTGNAKQTIGGVEMALGAVMMGMAAIPFVGPAMIGKGIALMAQGAGNLMMGNIDRTNGQGMLARAAEKLAKATESNILSKQEAKVVSREMQRAKLFAMKKELLEGLMENIRPMLDKAGIDGKDLNEDQVTKWFDKFMDDGAKTLAHGGILETDLKDIDGKEMFKDADGNPMKGNFYFMRDEAGDFYRIQPMRNENGEVALDAHGQPILDTEAGVSKVEDGDLKNYLDLQFQFVDRLKGMARSLGRTEFDDNGHATYTPYNTDNMDDMQDFADLVHKTNLTDIKNGKLKAPLKIIVEGDATYLQEWDYDNNIPLGPKTPLDDIAGGKFDRGDIDSYKYALQKSQSTLQSLGLAAGGDRFNLVGTVRPSNLAVVESQGNSFADLSSRSSDAFKNFGINLLNSSSSDNAGDGMA